MKLNGLNYIEIGKLDSIDKLKSIVSTESFNRSTLRETTEIADNPQRDTNIILGTFDIFEDIPGYLDKEVMSRYSDSIDEIMDVVKKFYGYKNIYIYSFCLIKLGAKKKIYEHTDDDSGMSARYQDCKRIHIPVITNKDTIFTIGGESRHLGYGNIYEIDNLITHSVENNGDSDRVHVLIDFVGETDYYNKSLPGFPETFYTK